MNWATPEQKVATGFLRNSMLNQEGGIEPEQFRTEAMIDRVDAIGRTWLGLTVNCAQCHNHKFDPISQREYYQVWAFLNNDDEPFLDVPTPDQQKKRDAITSAVRVAGTKAMSAASGRKPCVHLGPSRPTRSAGSAGPSQSSPRSINTRPD